MPNKGMRHYMNELESRAAVARSLDMYAASQVFDQAISYVNYGHGKPDREFLTNCLRSSQRSLSWVANSSQDRDREEEIQAWTEVVSYFNESLNLVAVS